jgi:hypothetical protein
MTHNEQQDTSKPDKLYPSDAAKRAAATAARNKRRREKYITDPAFRDATKTKRREGYERKSESLPNCMENLSSVNSSGTMVAVSYKNSPLVIGRVFTKTDVSKLLNRQPQVFFRWLSKNIFPDPVLADGKGQIYYSDQEVREFVKIMSEQQDATPHYRTDHDSVRKRLFSVAFIDNQSLCLEWIRNRQ